MFATQDKINQMVQVALDLHADKVSALRINIRKMSEEVEQLKEALEWAKDEKTEYRNDLWKIRDETEASINAMVHDTIIKLEAYEEAAQALLRRRV